MKFDRNLESSGKVNGNVSVHAEVSSVIDAQLSGDHWRLRYGEYDAEDALETMLLRSNDLRQQFKYALPQLSPRIDHDHSVTVAQLEKIFDEYDPLTANNTNGSFAFMVPSRTTRVEDGYSSEWHTFLPITRYASASTIQRFVSGVPPFAIDSYQTDQDGRRGLMILSPLFGDMTSDIGDDVGRLINTSEKIMTDTIDFTRRQGVEVVGLGATLPKILFLMQKINRAIDSGETRLTTGHAGTVWLIGETLREHVELEDVSSSVSIIGAGSIGSAVYSYLRNSVGFAGRITVSDHDPARLEQFGSDELTETTTDNAHAIAQSDTVISAVTRAIDLDQLKVDVRGKTIIDDSQPGCFNPKQIREYGGRLLWVIGQDKTPEGAISLKEFDYGDTGPASLSDVWGCEAEAYVTYANDLPGITRELEKSDVDRFSEFTQDAIAVAKPQRMGKYVVDQA